jgi:CRP-like cAMP-binding protein
MDALMDAVALLGRVSLFAGFSNQELEPLAAAARLRTFPKAAYIFHEGDPGNTLFVIRSGQVKIARIGPGGEEVVFAVLLPGDFFGEMALFDDEAYRTASAQAVLLTECLALSRELFNRFLDDHPQMARRLLRTLSLYIRRMDESLAEAAFADIPARVAGKLLELSEIQGEQTPEGIRIRTRLPQRTLAGMVGASRENVNRALRRFIVRGDIKQENGYITVVRPAELRKRS